MSKRQKRQSAVISARLYDDNPTEARALAIHEKWRKGSGFTSTEIITRALLALDEQPMPEKPDRLAARLGNMIEDLKAVIGQVGQGGISAPPPDESAPGVALDQSLIDSLAARASKGRRSSDG